MLYNVANAFFKVNKQFLGANINQKLRANWHDYVNMC